MRIPKRTPALTAEDAEDAEENQKRGRMRGSEKQPGAEVTADTEF